MRFLDIGPGNTRIPGFVTVDVVRGPGIDYVCDASGRLPFADNTFDIVHSSHCIEHISWINVEDTLKEWARVVKPGGSLEIWTVNGYKVMKAVVEYEETGVWTGPGIGSWRAEWTKGDPYKWSAGRLFCYKKGKTDAYLHKSLMTPKYLTACFEAAGLQNIRSMDESEIRGKRHPWINMGISGVKS